jgi:ABC-type phosphate transport system substrate-binding protein
VARLVPVLLGAALLAGARRAEAQTCSSLPSPIYGLGGSATKPLLGKVASALSGLPTPKTVVYQAPGACLGINGLLEGTKITGSASYWDATGKEQTCTLDTAGVDVEFANMVNSATLCPGITELRNDILDVLGPVNTFTLIVPKASSQLSISSAAAYFVFGFGDQSGVAPWTDQTQIARRDENSAAQLFIALATGVPATKFKGIDTKTNAGTISAVAGAAKFEAAIGLVSGELADANRDKVRILAYQHTGQQCAYWPDSTQTSLDKRNVRTGQYWIWSQIHFFTKIDPATKAPKYPAAREFIGLFSGETPSPTTEADLLRREVEAGTVPVCAMEVTRSGDLGPIQSFAPSKPCGCAFDKFATGTTTCQECTTDANCPTGAPNCRYGYCEVN